MEGKAYEFLMPVIGPDKAKYKLQDELLYLLKSIK